MRRRRVSPRNGPCSLPRSCRRAHGGAIKRQRIDIGVNFRRKIRDANL